jgi:uncharacterized spore protein YtfJ
MTEGKKRTFAIVETQEQGMDMLEEMTDVANVKAVYGEPVSAGEYTVITAAEVSASLGFGYGMGGSDNPPSGDDGVGETGFGGGGGGGGYTIGRPVAAIIAGPEGVRVEPILDLSKVGLAFLTMLGSLVVMLGRVFRSND